MLLKKNWHQRHFDTLGFGSRLADAVVKVWGPEIHNCTNDISRSVDGTKHDCLYKTLGCLSFYFA
jgi:hypothetical protein